MYRNSATSTGQAFSDGESSGGYVQRKRAGGEALPIDLHPNMTVIGFLGREMHVSDCQRLRIDENHRLHRVKREIRPITVAIARLIMLEATRVNGSNASPTDLLRAEPEQVSKLFPVVFMLPPGDGRVIR